MPSHWPILVVVLGQAPPTGVAARLPDLAGTKVDQTLDPTHRIRIQGSDRISQVSFSADGSTAYCVLPGQRVDVYALGREWWPELLGGVLALVVLAYLIVLVRVLRRPQRPGAPHCRRCNYDVTVQAPGSVRPRAARTPAAPGTRCPECGADLAKKPPRRGRSAARRLLAPSAAVGACVAGYAAMHAAGVPRTGPLSNAPEVWSAWMDGLDERHSLAAFRKHRTDVARIVRVDTRTGRVFGDLCTMRGYPAGDMRVSPDGRHIAVVGDATTLRWVRTSNGRTVARTTGGEFRGGGVEAEFIIGFSGPADTPWVYFAAVDQATGRSRLVRWRPIDGRQEVVVEEPGYEMTYANGMRAHQARRYALLHRAEGVATVSAPGFSEAAQTNQYELTVRGPIESGSQVERVIPVREGSVSMSPLVPTPDGQTIFISASHRGIIGFDTRTGEPLGRLSPALTQPPGQDLAISSDGRLLFVPVIPSSVLVRDVTRKRWAGELTFPAQFIAPKTRPSPDGRWAAVVAFRAQGAGAGARYEHELFLYDLRALRDDPKAEQP